MTTVPLILAKIERADKKIDNLQERVYGFLEANAHELIADGDIEMLDAGKQLIADIDDLLADIWKLFQEVLPLLEEISSATTGDPLGRCSDLSYPPIKYGIENKSATTIIEGVARYVGLYSDLCNAINFLVALSDKAHRKFVVVREGANSFRNRHSGYSEPQSIKPFIAVIRDDDAGIQNTVLKSLCHPPGELSVLGLLSDITAAIQTTIEVSRIK